ncbi:Rv0909 family putative TA system antitoxin, partial [Colwellia asteriadis]|uniref:Rv0909 family putative TA system antitoxin n=1 Tax=Colwellia asteriadis TaxID=517723 RepID=UPI0031CDE8EB
MGMFDNLKGLADQAREKATELVDQHGDKVEQGLEKAGQLADERTVVATRRSAPRQETWSRADPRVRWVDALAPDVLERSLAVLAAVRSATVGMPLDETACAPFTDGRWLVSHNGSLDRTVLPARHEAESACDAALLAAHVLALGDDLGGPALARRRHVADVDAAEQLRARTTPVDQPEEPVVAGVGDDPVD